MCLFSAVRLLQLPKNIIVPIQYAIQANSYAGPIASLGKKKASAAGRKGSLVKKVVLPVETDVNRLLKFCCGANILKEGGEEIELKPDSEYPDWLWTIRTGPPPPLEELDPDTKAYWRRLRKEALRRNNKLYKLKKFQR